MLPSFLERQMMNSSCPPGSRRGRPPLPPKPFLPVSDPLFPVSCSLAAGSCFDGDITKTWSPQMIGVLPLHEGSSDFQTMFSFFSRFQVVGKPVESLVPSALGPRHCGQFSPAVKPPKQ